MSSTRPLTATINGRIAPNRLLADIVSELFIEDWSDVIDFHAYYEHCAPEQCTYTYEGRFNKAHIIAAVLGVAGGLSVVLEILIPPTVKVCRRLLRHTRGCHSRHLRDAVVQLSVRTNCRRDMN